MMSRKLVWHTSKRAISIGISRRPIIDVVFNGMLPGLSEYEEAFAEYARIVEDGQQVVWLIDMCGFSPLNIDAKTRKAASEVFFRYQPVLQVASVAEARVTQNMLTRCILTAFDWITGSNKWPCQQFETHPEAEAWLLHQLRRRWRR